MHQGNISRETQYYIQYLRALAASIVVLHHVSYQVVNSVPANTIFRTFPGLAEFGAGGVDVFFVISGFIIFYTMAEKTSLSSAREFIKQRFLRVVPLYWFWSSVLVLGILLGVALAQTKLTPWMLVSSFALVPYEKSPGNFHPILDQGWTLSFEMYFYVVAAILIACIPYARRLPVLVAIIAFVQMAMWVLPAPEVYRQWLGSTLVYEFCIGAAIAVFFRHPTPGMRTGERPWLGLLILSAGASALVATAAMEDAARYRLLVWGVPSAMMVFGAVLANRRPSGAITRGLFWLGAASYSLYLTHTLFAITLGGLLKRGYLTKVNPDLLTVLATVLIIIVGSLSYIVVERPLLGLLRGKRTSVPVSPATASA